MFNLTMLLQALSTPSRRYRVPLLSFFVVFGIVFSYCHTFSSLPDLPAFKYPSFWWYSASTSSTASKFWPAFAPLLASTAPSIAPPSKPRKHAVAKNRYYNESWNLRPGKLWISDEFPNLLNMTDASVSSMRTSHSAFMELLQTSAPALDYKKGTKGIVTTAGGSYFPVLIISLLMLRRTGSILPVEIFLTTADEYEPALCDIVLPKLNAKCIVLSDLLRHSPVSFPLKTYQLKVFAMLFSSFESLLFLDADNFPLHPPEELFTTKPFTRDHMVLWPDYWTPTISPYFSAITGLNHSLLKTRPTIEAGQIMISKKHHTKTLLLAAYYNVYATHFYNLISQGGPGEGDKDTFAPAALVLNATFYTVETPPHNLGIRRNGGSAVIQYDPSMPFRCPKGSACSQRERPFFIHASWPPKLNALKKVETQRRWGPIEESKALFEGMDLEKVVWGHLVHVACDKEFEFIDWGHGNKSTTVVCEQSRKCYKDVFGEEYGGGKNPKGSQDLT